MQEEEGREEKEAVVEKIGETPSCFDASFFLSLEGRREVTRVSLKKRREKKRRPGGEELEERQMAASAEKKLGGMAKERRPI